jgi:2'-5' RNA ligase
MRLFAAVYPPEVELTALDSAVTAAGAADGRLRLVPLDQRHVTVAFFGNVDEQLLPELTDRLGRAAKRTTAMSLQIQGIGTFPKQSVRARVLWAGLAGDVNELSRLAERCTAAARRTGISMEDRAFRPHLTIGRSRHDPVDARPIVDELHDYAGNSWPVTDLKLMLSKLGPKVTHQVLQAWPLGKGASTSAEEH